MVVFTDTFNDKHGLEFEQKESGDLLIRYWDTYRTRSDVLFRARSYADKAERVGRVLPHYYVMVRRK